MFVKKIDTNLEGTDASDFQSERGAVGAAGIGDLCSVRGQYSE